ncbi:hypothetical protein [Flavobacterium defluvii]|uniref:Uncharacterized protein n=1 Tax=Flavobacterium defluvii TaxID=370979 RepID=A0A1M5HYQ0_9FLAO|nr:hypothetical protein [Flavobacterium defluvii]SHG21037.1 hypothetical protein SAMN05443663_102195 [Flavobacterium defluvii]
MYKFKNDITSQLFFLLVFFSLFSCQEDDIRRIRLKTDQKKVTSNPNEESDLISYFVKESVSRSLTGIDMDKLKYYSVERNDTILVITKVTDMIGIQRESRKKLLYAIHYCLISSERYCQKKIYIDVEGNFSTLLVKTPVKQDLDGRFADEKLLLSFYGRSKVPFRK